MCTSPEPAAQSGGVIISGAIDKVAGDIVGGNLLKFGVDVEGVRSVFRQELARIVPIAQTVASYTDRAAQLIEFPYATTPYELFEIVEPQPYTYLTTTALRELIHGAGQPSHIVGLAAELIPSIWNSNPNVAGILSIMLGSFGEMWQPADQLVSKLEQLCDGAIRSGDWSRVASIEPLAFALGAKGSLDIHRRLVGRLIEEPHWRDADSSRVREYYGTVGIEIASILRHWDDPFRKGLLRVNDVGRVMNLLLSTDGTLVKGRTRQRVLALLEEHAVALKDFGEGALARRVNQLVTALLHIAKISSQ
jgi:hypothetical protein